MNKLKARLRSGKACVNAWLAIPSGFSAEVMAQCGWDSVTVDMHHGETGIIATVRGSPRRHQGADQQEEYEEESYDTAGNHRRQRTEALE
jgi:hypothetical protein